MLRGVASALFGSNRIGIPSPLLTVSEKRAQRGDPCHLGAGPEWSTEMVADVCGFPRTGPLANEHAAHCRNPLGGMHAGPRTGIRPFWVLACQPPTDLHELEVVGTSGFGRERRRASPALTPVNPLGRGTFRSGCDVGRAEGATHRVQRDRRRGENPRCHQVANDKTCAEPEALRQIRRVELCDDV